MTYTLTNLVFAVEVEMDPSLGRTKRRLGVEAPMLARMDATLVRQAGSESRDAEGVRRS